MKTFLFIFIFALSLNATTIYNGKCVQSFQVFASASPLVNITYFHTTTIETVPYTDSLINSLVSNDGKFIYIPTGGVTTRCHYVENNNTLGMTNEQYSFMMAFLSSLTGILIGFTILFFAIFLTIKVGSKK